MSDVWPRQQPIYIVSLGAEYMGFHMPPIETPSTTIYTLPAIGTEEEAREAIASLAKISELPTYQFRILKFVLADVLEG